MTQVNDRNTLTVEVEIISLCDAGAASTTTTTSSVSVSVIPNTAQHHWSQPPGTPPDRHDRHGGEETLISCPLWQRGLWPVSHPGRRLAAHPGPDTFYAILTIIIIIIIIFIIIPILTITKIDITFNRCSSRACPNLVLNSNSQ